MKRSSKHNENNTTQWKARGFRSSSDVEKGNSESNPSPRQTEKPPKVFAVPAGFKKSRLLNQECEEKSPISEVTDSSTIPKPTKPKTSEAKQRPTNKSSKKIKKEVKKPEGEASEEVVGQGKEEEKTNPNKRKKQKFQGYTLFIGNLSYDTTKEDIQNHFAKCGAIKNVRIPLDKATNQSRGFGYIEVEEHVTYEKVLSLHHSFLKRRRINVECTFGGSKTSQKRKALIKEKTLKLRFLSREGKISSAKQRPWGKFTMTKSSDT